MSDEQDEIRARYEAAMEVMPPAERQTLKLEAVTASLADIPRLLGEVERLTVKHNDMFDSAVRLNLDNDILRVQLAEKEKEVERLKEAFDASLDSTEKAEREAFDLRAQLACDACDGTGQAASGPCGCNGRGVWGMLETVRRLSLKTEIQLAEKEKEIEPLKKAIFDAEDVAEELGFAEGKYLAEVIREQASRLAERDAEIGRLEGILQSATETFTAAQLGKESQIESLSTENKRLREALTELQVVAQESYERTSTNCRKRRERLSSALRRAGEAMEEKGDDFYIVVEKGNTRNIYDDKGLVRSEEKGEQGDEQV